MCTLKIYYKTETILHIHATACLTGMAEIMKKGGGGKNLLQIF